MTSTANKDLNLEFAEHLIEGAARQGAKFVCLPENFAYLGEHPTAHAESLDESTISRLRSCAKAHKVWLSLGGFQEKAAGDRHYNSHLIVDDEGAIRAVYRKIHLFSVKLPDGSVYDEKKSVIPGREPVSLRLPFFNCGLSICYDVRFPKLYATLRDAGAEVMLIPAAFTKLTGLAHWEVLLRARAIETQSYVIASAQVGLHFGSRITYGHAMIVDPWGAILANCGDTGEIACAEIDIKRINTLREEMPFRLASVQSEI